MSNNKKGIIAVIVFLAVVANFIGFSFDNIHWRQYLPKGIIGVSIPYEAVEYKGHHYHVYDDFVASWNDAEDFCESKGGHLVAINDEEENNRVYKIMRDSGFKTAYIGFYDPKATGVWGWINGEPVSYTHWMSDTTPAPVRNYQYALYLEDKDGRWGMDTFTRHSPDDKIAFICEWDE